MEQPEIIDAHLSHFANEQGLPAQFIPMARQWYWPLCREVATKVARNNIRVLGISGSQGSGKSTLANLLAYLLTEQDGLKVASLSMDDFYLSLAERQSLAKTVHPLFITRGVPGTHDIPLAIDTINHLLSTAEVSIPRFDKAADDRKPQDQWNKVQAPVDLVILEGWCLSIPPETDPALQQPQNKLEAGQDPDGIWRRYANDALARQYPALFQLIDCLVYLRSPNFAAVRRWRGNQEHKLLRASDPSQSSKIMDDEALDFFMSHYQRLTRQSFATLPQIADVVFSLNEEQQITRRINQ